MWFESPTEELGLLGRHLGVTLLAKRDDLLPFPLAGNKARKLRAEFNALSTEPDLIVTNGAVASNHCRTVAIMCAMRGMACHLVLHGDPDDDGTSASVRMLRDLGARYTIVSPGRISDAIAEVVRTSEGSGGVPHVLPGGCHTPAGAVAYRDAAHTVLDEQRPSWVIVASGTGATHGGIAAAAHARGDHAQVVGISVARTAERGVAAVSEAARWAGAPTDLAIDFRDEHVDGGYGHYEQETLEAVSLGWRFGLPLDPTYTGKAFAGLLAMVGSGEISRDDRVLFWHTGGLMNYLAPTAAPRRGLRGDGQAASA